MAQTGDPLPSTDSSEWRIKFEDSPRWESYWGFGDVCWRIADTPWRRTSFWSYGNGKRWRSYMDLHFDSQHNRHNKLPVYLDKESPDHFVFRCVSSTKGGIDIIVGSSTVHMPKHCSVHHPVVQMLLFATLSMFHGVFRCPHSMVPKAIINIEKKDACIPTCHSCVPQAGWVPAEIDLANLKNGGAISDSSRKKVESQTDRYDWPSSPVFFSVSIKSGTLICRVPRSNKTQEDGFLSDARASCHANGKSGMACWQTSSAACEPSSVTLGVRSTGNVSLAASIGSTHLAPSNADGVTKWAQEPEEQAEQQCILKNPGDEKNFLHCELDQPILSKYPDTNEVSLGDSKSTHLRVGEGTPRNSSGHSEGRHDSKMFALVIPQPLAPGDGASSSTATPAPVLWLDSGATHHVVGDDRILTDLHDPPAGMAVAVADGFRLPVAKIGAIQTPDIKIRDVYFVPGLAMNLISVRQLGKNKIITTFYENHAELWLGAVQIGGAIIDETASLYKLRYLGAT